MGQKPALSSLGRKSQDLRPTSTPTHHSLSADDGPIGTPGAQGLPKGLPDCHCLSLEGLGGGRAAIPLGQLGDSHMGQTDPGCPPTLQLWDPVTEACGTTTSRGPPRTEEQGQKSRQKNVVLPAFHG